ncbi:hypothetical protein F5888DRAFT_1001071 [Russula emetica]|nr:hypothetical protein F5888DRAFT_1001071 [Russula emetica]
MDTERSRRHATKLLTYPITIGSVIHQFSALTLGNQRLTPEGSRSLAALRLTLHGATGTPETEEASIDKPQMRIFILGARAESSLPRHVWEQLTLLFPAALFHLYFIGPQVSLPKPPAAASTTASSDPTSEAGSQVASASSSPREEASASAPSAKSDEKKPVYLPNVYEPPTPAPISRHKRTRSSIERYGVPSYTVPYTPQLTITGMQCNYHEVHAQFQDTFDPYTDLFLCSLRALGFPHRLRRPMSLGNLSYRLSLPPEWGPVLPLCWLRNALFS